MFNFTQRNLLRPLRNGLFLSMVMIFGTGCAMEKGFIYHPEKRLIATPADAGLSFEDLDIVTEDGVHINGWFVPYKGSEQALLWFHGNAGNISHRVDLLQRLHHELKLNILIIDYRGYGKSGGKLSEAGIVKDARAAYDTLLARKEINPKQIFIFGRSLGSAVAVTLATESQAAALILEAPFTSIKDMVKVTLPWLPFKGRIKTKYDSLGKIKDVHTPLLIMHGDQDKTIPFAHGQRLFEAANDPKTFHTISGADHNNSYVVGGRAYFEAMSRFIHGLPLQ
ncbi:MAG: alpha/beta hydrolase [Nitrospiria bacterium]